MFCCRIANPSYELREPLSKITAEEYAKFRKDLRILDLPEDQEKLNGWYGANDVIIDQEELEMISAIVEVRVSKVKGLGVYLHDHATVERGGRDTYQVSVPDVGLLSIDCVEVLEDCCTYQLQDMLNAGWRIIAVCPPNKARRPDYVLGRTGKPE